LSNFGWWSLIGPGNVKLLVLEIAVQGQDLPNKKPLNQPTN
jgi:hypothetical protein